MNDALAPGVIEPFIRLGLATSDAVNVVLSVRRPIESPTKVDGVGRGGSRLSRAHS